jgi:hypothetical protein
MTLISLSSVIAVPPPTAIAKGVIIADGTEQIIINTSEPSIISGYLDLSNMQAGDSVEVREYMLIDSVEHLYADITYTGVQASPIYYITPKPVADAIKITIQQLTGVFRSFYYVIFKE